jgi:1-acyl-sn-glycerol-3-phosphate acyltransferase
MLNFLPHMLKGSLSVLFCLLNTISLSIPIILLSFFKFIFPVRSLIIVLDKILMSIATLWIDINSTISNLFCKIDWDVRGLEKLELNEWYLVLSNHQSWVDIMVLQKTLNKKIPMLKFFLKRELIWVPFLGLAWWALDFPFMKRYSRKQLQAKPHLKGKDLESTKKACEKFKHTPVAIMNFVEGTRFTPQKKIRQNNNYEHLLKPKAGGITFVLGSMGEYLHKVIDITIVYPDKIPTFWEYLSGRVNKIIVDFEVIPLKDFMGNDSSMNIENKNKIFNWLNERWYKKDKKIKILKE